MATQAISSYGIALRLGNGVPLASVAVTGGTTATPIVITTGTPHGIPVNDVDVVTIAGVVGLNANGTWIVQALTATTFRLRGSAGVGTYSSGGTATRGDTYTTIAELTDLQDAGIMCTV